MPYYASLNPKRPDDRRTAEGLLRLRLALGAEVPAKSIDDTLLIASWNLREFGGTKYGGREREALFYIAEVISHFDLVAVQEVRDNLDVLDDLMRLLGGWWDYLVTDVTVGRQGNGERLAFIYDKRKVNFGGLAGEITSAMVKSGDTLSIPRAFARSPYLVGMQAGWFKFTLCTGHLYYGEDKADDPVRLAEMRELVELLKDRVDAKDRWARNSILLGDFNIFRESDQTFAALTTVFEVPPAIKGRRTNQSRTKPFDQIAFLSPDVGNQIADARGGVFDYYQHVYRDADAALYPVPDGTTFSTWRSYKMSDHLLLWTEVKVDFGAEYLKKKATPPA
ncbi:MAG: endonuclease/exonuclease/phosphatase family protein [Gemmatimonadetes bacterium]|nr:endonuclease/exonuclease/phosphatase family protein [Gemmatimonadota bacterium]